MVVLGGVAVSYERGTPVQSRRALSYERGTPVQTFQGLGKLNSASASYC